jgi:hypothetical protein
MVRTDKNTLKVKRKIEPQILISKIVSVELRTSNRYRGRAVAACQRLKPNESLTIWEDLPRRISIRQRTGSRLIVLPKKNRSMCENEAWWHR